MTQRALKHGPGRFRDLVTFAGTPAATRAAAVCILEQVEILDEQFPLQVLVAVAPEATGAMHASALVEERDGALAGEENAPTWTGPTLLVQIAAETADDLTFARRLVKWATVEAKLQKLEELSGNRRLRSRENFGYSEGTSDAPQTGSLAMQQGPAPQGGSGHAAVPSSAAGTTWLLYQRCVQDVVAFAAVDDAEVLRAGHLENMQAFAGPLLRRSFDYESYDESGLAFVACAASPAELSAALRAFRQTDPLKDWVLTPPEGRGLFVVPESSNWLRGESMARVPDLPSWVAQFRRQHPLVLYEVVPKTLMFLRRAFRMNEDKLLEGDHLRPDLQLVGRGLVKLLLGHRIPSGSLNHEYLARLFGPKPTNPLEVAAVAGKPRPVQLGSASVADLEAERLAEEVKSPVVNADYDDLFQLALEGVEQARLVNQEQGEYVTFNV